MDNSSVFTIEFTPDALRHLKSLRAYERARIVDSVDEQLTHQPTTETRRRKKLDPNTLAERELRVGEVRVLYNVLENEVLVLIIAIGRKDGDRLIIEGEEVQI